MNQTPTLIKSQLIVGLGNPEPKYDQTRHNIGFETVDFLAKSWGLSWQKESRFRGWFTEGFTTKGHKIRLLKPTTYMNLSGESVNAVLSWYKLPVESLLIIYDDMDLPLGRLRLRISGSAGGHNGMKSIIAHLGSQNFPRLRIGIGKSQHKTVTISHVLGKFDSQEAPIMKEVLQLAQEAIEISLIEGMEKAMSLYNNRTII